MAELLKRLRRYQDEAEVDLSVPVFKHLHLFGVEGDITPVNLDPLLDEAKENLLELETELKEVKDGAGFWIRSLARIIDLIVHNVIVIIVSPYSSSKSLY